MFTKQNVNVCNNLYLEIRNKELDMIQKKYLAAQIDDSMHAKAFLQETVKTLYTCIVELHYW